LEHFGRRETVDILSPLLIEKAGRRGGFFWELDEMFKTIDTKFPHTDGEDPHNPACTLPPWFAVEGVGKEIVAIDELDAIDANVAAGLACEWQEKDAVLEEEAADLARQQHEDSQKEDAHDRELADLDEHLARERELDMSNKKRALEEEELRKFEAGVVSGRNGAADAADASPPSGQARRWDSHVGSTELSAAAGHGVHVHDSGGEGSDSGLEPQSGQDDDRCLAATTRKSRLRATNEDNMRTPMVITDDASDTDGDAAAAGAAAAAAELRREAAEMAEEAADIGEESVAAANAAVAEANLAVDQRLLARLGETVAAASDAAPGARDDGAGGSGGEGMPRVGAGNEDGRGGLVGAGDRNGEGGDGSGGGVPQFPVPPVAVNGIPLLRAMYFHARARVVELSNMLSASRVTIITVPSMDGHQTLGTGNARHQWAAVPALAGHYDSYISYLHGLFVRLEANAGGRVIFGSVRGALASARCIQVWGANWENWELPNGTQITGEGQARCMGNQKPGVFGVVTTPKGFLVHRRSLFAPFRAFRPPTNDAAGEVASAVAASDAVVLAAAAGAGAAADGASADAVADAVPASASPSVPEAAPTDAAADEASSADVAADAAAPENPEALRVAAEVEAAGEEAQRIAAENAAAAASDGAAPADAVADGAAPADGSPGSHGHSSADAVPASASPPVPEAAPADAAADEASSADVAADAAAAEKAEALRVAAEKEAARKKALRIAEENVAAAASDGAAPVDAVADGAHRGGRNTVSGRGGRERDRHGHRRRGRGAAVPKKKRRKQVVQRMGIKHDTWDTVEAADTGPQLLFAHLNGHDCVARMQFNWKVRSSEAGMIGVRTRHGTNAAFSEAVTCICGENEIMKTEDATYEFVSLDGRRDQIRVPSFGMLCGKCSQVPEKMSLLCTMCKKVNLIGEHASFPCAAQLFTRCRARICAACREHARTAEYKSVTVSISAASCIAVTCSLQYGPPISANVKIPLG